MIDEAETIDKDIQATEETTNDHKSGYQPPEGHGKYKLVSRGAWMKKLLAREIDLTGDRSILVLENVN